MLGILASLFLVILLALASAATAYYSPSDYSQNSYCYNHYSQTYPSTHVQFDGYYPYSPAYYPSTHYQLDKSTDFKCLYNNCANDYPKVHIDYAQNNYLILKNGAMPNVQISPSTNDWHLLLYRAY